ncbi:MAG: peptide chain release factor 2 [Puniceicoccales bacterium]|nr:peptide chain release factor 2 [Puniceicoccales bacterium]
MILPPHVRSQVETLLNKAGHLWRFLEVDAKRSRLKQWEEQMASEGFWEAVGKAQETLIQAKQIKKQLGDVDELNGELSDLKGLLEICEDSSEDEGTVWLAELEGTLAKLQKKIDVLELQSFLTGPTDGNNAILTIHSGAGGTEACDWASMVFRMYLRWAERSGFTTQLQSSQEGDEAGISRVTFTLNGPNAYGYAKAERGVHRLVRISPFDANKKRHTSFCSVDVVAELEEDIAVEIDEKDLRIDTYRSSGKGGQHVNKTESAVRITHLPSGIVVACQTERSQIKNRSHAMKILKSRLYEKMQDEKRSERERFYGEKGEIGWGYQIRSYVFQPYQMVKDLRTGMETGNLQAVMDGDIDLFIQAWLRAGCPRSRTKGREEDA